MSKKIKKILIVLIFICITFIYYMQSELFWSVDSAKYYSYLKIFDGVVPFSTWDNLRGFSFPLVLWIMAKFFGVTEFGFKIGFYFVYLFTIFLAFLCMNFILKKYNIKKEKIFYFLFLLIFPFNYLIIGWTHAVLTEALVPLFYFLTFYLCINWIEFDVNLKGNIKTIIICILLSICSIFVWFIKQPYAPSIWIICVLSFLVSVFSKKNIKIIMRNVCVLIIVFTSTFYSIKIWDGLLLKDTKNYNVKTNNEAWLSGNIQLGLRYHVRYIKDNTFCNDRVLKNKMIDNRDLRKIKKLMVNDDWCDYLEFYEIYDLDNKNVIDVNYYYKNGKEKNVVNSFNFAFSLLIEHPIIIFNTYMHNYLLTIGIEEKSNEALMPSGKVSFNTINENLFAYWAFDKKNNMWWNDFLDNETNHYLYEQHELLIDPIKQFETENRPNKIIAAINKFLMKFTNASFCILLLICIPIFVLSLYKTLRKNKKYYYIMILSGTAFGHVLFHSVMGAVIDRYAYPVYPLMLLCLICIVLNVYSYVVKKNR